MDFELLYHVDLNACVSLLILIEGTRGRVGGGDNEQESMDGDDSSIMRSFPQTCSMGSPGLLLLPWPFTWSKSVRAGPSGQTSRTSDRWNCLRRYLSVFGWRHRFVRIGLSDGRASGGCRDCRLFSIRLYGRRRVISDADWYLPCFSRNPFGILRYNIDGGRHFLSVRQNPEELLAFSHDFWGALKVETTCKKKKTTNKDQ